MNLIEKQNTFNDALRSAGLLPDEVRIEVDGESLKLIVRNSISGSVETFDDDERINKHAIGFARNCSELAKARKAMCETQFSVERDESARPSPAHTGFHSRRCFNGNAC